MNPVIETDHLVKRYGSVTAVDGLSVRVAKGEIYAFLGLNGAGKTTTIRLLLGMVRPTSGEARVLGTRIRVGAKKPWDSVGSFFASAGHGYLPPMGVAMLAMFLAQVVAIAGWGEYFPWSIPGLYSQGGNLGTVSYVIVILTSVAGMAGTFIWWELADQTH